MSTKFNSKGITSTLINRVYRTGINMMDKIDRAENKNEHIDHHLIDDLQTDYYLSIQELESSIITPIVHDGSTESWEVFVDAYTGLKDEEKVLYRGVVKGVKNIASNLLQGKIEGILPYAPHVYMPFLPEATPTFPTDIPKDIWESIFAETEKMEASNKDILGNLSGGVAAVAGACAAVAGGAAAVATGTIVAAGLGAFAGGVAIGNAINEMIGND